VGGLKFDKDDPQALDFVTAASNLRASIFNIPRQSRFDAKEIAGNIIPAIATTNAIIAGGIVLEALKVLAGREDECKYAVCNRYLSGRKQDVLLNATKLDVPNPICYVCGTSVLNLTLDTTKFTVQMLIEQVVQKHLSFNRPTIDYVTLSGGGDQLCEGVEDELDENEIAKFKRYLPINLASLPRPIVSGTKLDVFDTSQDLSLTIQVCHKQLTEEEAPSGFITSGDATKAPSKSLAPEPASGNKRSLEGAPADGTKKPRSDDAEGVVLLDD